MVVMVMVIVVVMVMVTVMVMVMVMVVVVVVVKCFFTSSKVPEEETTQAPANVKQENVKNRFK